MELRQLRELIENGRVAKLRFKPVNSIHYIHEVRVKKLEEWYIYQLKIFLQEGTGQTLIPLAGAKIPEGVSDRHFSEHTELLQWSDVLKQIGGAASSSDWVIVDEELDPFPIERRAAP